MDSTKWTTPQTNPSSQQATRDGVEDAHGSRSPPSTLKLGLGRRLAAVGQLSNQHFKKLKSRLQTKLNVGQGLEASTSDPRRFEDPGENKLDKTVNLEVQEVMSLSSLKSVSLSSSSHSKTEGERAISATVILDSSHLPRTQLRFVPEVFDERPMHDDSDIQFKREESKSESKPDAFRVYGHRSLEPPDPGAKNQVLERNCDWKSPSKQRCREQLLLNREEGAGGLPLNELIRSSGGLKPDPVLNKRYSDQSNDLSSHTQDTEQSLTAFESSSLETSEIRALQFSDAHNTTDMREGFTLMKPSGQRHPMKCADPFSESRNITGLKEDNINKCYTDKYAVDSEMTSLTQRSTVVRDEPTRKQNAAHPASEKQRPEAINYHLRSISNDISAPGVTPPPHIAVPVFSKDVHVAIKHVMRYRHANEDAHQLPPAETAFPKSTIILDRAQTGSPYFKHDPLHEYQAPPVKSYTQDTPRMISPNFQQYSVSDFLPRRPAPLAPPLYSMSPQYPGPPRSYTVPYPQSFLPAPSPLPLPPQGVHFQPNDYVVSRNSSAPSRIHLNKGNGIGWHPAPTAPLETNESEYSRIQSSRSSVTPASWYDTITSMFGFRSNRFKDEPPAHRASFTPSDHRDSVSSRRSIHDKLFTRTMEPTPAPSVRFNQRTTSDDVILQMVCCCCWPIGLAARIIMILVPSHQATCVALIARRLSIYALLLGIAVYLVIMVTFIALLLALVKERG